MKIVHESERGKVNPDTFSRTKSLGFSFVFFLLYNTEI